MTTHFHVVGAALADRHALVRQIGNRQQPAVATLLNGVELDSELLDLLRSLTVGLLNLAGVLPWRFARATSSPAVFCSRLSPSSSGSIRADAIRAWRALRARSTSPRHAFVTRTVGLRDCHAGSLDRACCRFYLR